MVAFSLLWFLLDALDLLQASEVIVQSDPIMAKIRVSFPLEGERKERVRERNERGVRGLAEIRLYTEVLQLY